jgi:hypothetical protein
VHFIPASAFRYRENFTALQAHRAVLSADESTIPAPGST